MSTTDRQNRLLLAEDWKRVYQTFKTADFKSYDFDSLRRTMIAYLRENYPEDFNDYIESSEYLALIDLIAYLGQNIAFRIDLNARENYLELAERRESVLRLARLLSYNPKRVRNANGLLKIESIRSSEEVIDANGVNLEDQTIIWNDPSNPDWYEQFIKVLNSALPVNNAFGKPVKKETVNDIPTEQYRLNSTNTEVPAFGFTKNVDGRSTRFEVVSTDVDGDIVEEAPYPGNNFAFLYRNDGRGSASSNSGFFCMFKQGALDSGQFTIASPSTNQIVAIDSTNINNSDVWLYKLDTLGNEEELWTKVDAVEGNNIIYNSVNKKIRNIYSVLTRAEDRVSFIFSDGVFGNLPKGSFRTYYRNSRADRVIVTPEGMRGISVTIPYLSKQGKQEEITLSLELKYTVDNSSTSETSASIKKNAPSTYYTQNRLITGEDYQVGPLGINQEIIKAKAVNRTTSGISRYFDLLDATGKYSKTNIYGNDGVIYKEYLNPKESFTFTTKTDVQGAILNTVEPILASKNVRNYYYDTFPKKLVGDLGVTWLSETTDTNQNTGYFQKGDIKSFVGSFTGNNLKLIVPGALVKFEAPAGQHFMADDSHKLMTGSADHTNAVTYKWTKIVSVEGNGTVKTDAGLGAIQLNDIIPSGAKLTQILPYLSNTLQNDVNTQVTDQIFNYRTFGLRFDIDLGNWRLITENNLNLYSGFSTGKTGDTTNQQLDASWILLFETDGQTYNITYRSMRYVFESDQEVRFYYDSSDKIYNNLTGKIVKDKISILDINKKPDVLTPFTTDWDWEVVEEYRDAEGYIDSKKIQISFFDEDEDGVVDDPDLFEQIVAPTTNASTKYIFFKKVITDDGVEDFNYDSTTNITVLGNKSELTNAPSKNTDGQVFYYIQEDIFEKFTKSTGTYSVISDYKARLGRDTIKFQYIHAADDSSRIDPSASNIIDLYVLTKTYDTSYRKYLNNVVATKPLPASSDALAISYGPDINKIKSLSDEVIYHPVKYKVLFGTKAETGLQARFKVVKNPDLVLNDNDIKTRIVSAINQYFALDNWDFGEKFYFTEMSSYVMGQLAPDLVTFVIVPTQESQAFGSLFEIKSETDEIFISGATVDDVEIIDAVTATKLKASGVITTTSASTNTGIQSAEYVSETTTTNTSTNTSTSTSTSSSSSSSGGGYSY